MLKNTQFRNVKESIKKRDKNMYKKLKKKNNKLLRVDLIPVMHQSSAMASSIHFM